MQSIRNYAKIRIIKYSIHGGNKMGKIKLLSNIINFSTNQVEGYCVVKAVQLKVNVKGAEYLDFTLSDAEGEINAKLWDYQSTAHGSYNAGDVIKIRATVNMYRDAEQLKIDRIRHVNPSDDVDMSQLVASSPFDGEKLYQEMYDLVGGFKNEELSRLTRYLMREHRDKLVNFPGALRMHHAMRGGLMYHTHTMLSVAKEIVKVYSQFYPELCAELVYSGVILHDIAKTLEYDIGDTGLATAYSTEGQLLGHISMGMAMIEQASAELSISRETTNLLSHILLSHHGVPEFGSPKLPLFPEAEIVSTVDTLDAKLFEMYDALGSTEIGKFSDRVWGLDNRQLYRHGYGLKTDTED